MRPYLCCPSCCSSPHAAACRSRSSAIPAAPAPGSASRRRPASLSRRPRNRCCPTRAATPGPTPAAALVNEESRPRIRRSAPGDWSLTLSADLRGPNVIPSYTVPTASASRRGRPRRPGPSRLMGPQRPRHPQIAAEQPPRIATLLTRIEAARLQNDPNSLQNRPARVYRLRRHRRARRRRPQPGRANAREARPATASSSRTRAKTPTSSSRRGPHRSGARKAPRRAAMDRRRRPRRARPPVQLNEARRQRVDRYWGDVAVVAAEEAAGGVKDVIFNATGPRLDRAARSGTQNDARGDTARAGC